MWAEGVGSADRRLDGEAVDIRRPGGEAVTARTQRGNVMAARKLSVEVRVVWGQVRVWVTPWRLS